MAWSDEFSGSGLDGSKWTIGTGARRDATNTANAISVGGGALTVKTYTEGGKHYTGWLGTNGKFENCFGYWEARIRFNGSAGMWSAFWLQPNGINNVGDPAGNGTEIDIAEHRRQDAGGTDMRNKSAMNVHWDGYASDHKSVGSTVNNPGADGSSLQGNYHTYGLLWDPWRYTFYIDGVEVWTTTAAISQVRQWIYLTCEVDTDAWAGAIPSGGYGDRTATGTKLEVDWVRFWQRDEMVVNSGFSYRSGAWDSSGAASWSSTGGRGGGAGVRLNPSTATASSFEQNVHGLLPNTEYRVLGWGDVGTRTWPDVRIGVKNFGGTETYQSLWSDGFTQAQVPFTTGGSNSSARVYARVATQWGDCYADDLDIRRDGQINNGGFEFGDTRPWAVYGDAFVHDWATYVRSGRNAFRFNASSADRGAEQTVYGLQPDTPYTLSAWVRTGGQPIRFGVKNHGGTESFSTFTGTGNTWQRATHSFTTGPAATTAAIYIYIPAGSNVSAADLDDFTLAQALPAEWSGSDIGATGRNGESYSRGGKIVIRGSGANVFDSADSFHFVRRPISGDFALTAKLDSFEAASEVAKAGVMLRGSAAEDSAHAMVHWLPQGQVEFIWRASDGAVAGYVWATATTPWPPRLRLQRAGQLVSASYSTNGSTWTMVGAPQAIDLPATVLGGPAVCAHDTGDTGVATFSNISTNGDRDGDGVLDEYETLTGVFVSAINTGTDPDNPDTDGDGFADGLELANGTNPVVPNTEMVWQSGLAPGGSGAWDATTPNWRTGGGATAWIPGKSALFGGTAGTVTVGSGATGIAGMTFNSPNYTLDGSGPLAFAQEAALANAATGNTIIATPLAGTSTLGLTGGGTLHLRGDNRGFLGALVVDGNTQIRPYNSSSNSASGYETGGAGTTVEIRPGSQIRWYNLSGSPVYASGFRIAGTGLAGGNPGALNLDTSVVRTVTLNGGVEVVADAMIGTQNNGAYVFNGPVTGTGALTVLQAAGSSVFNGGVAVPQVVKTGGGSLVFGASAAPNLPLLTYQAGSLGFAAGTSAGVQTIALAANLPLDVPGTLVIPSVLTGSSTLTKSGAGTLVLSAANAFGPAGGTFTLGGGTTNVGALRLTHPQALGNHSKILLGSDQGGISRLELSGSRVFPLNVDTAGRNTAAGSVAVRNLDGANTLQGNITITAIGGFYYFEAVAGSSLTITGNLSTSLNAASNRDVRILGDGDLTLQGAIADSVTATPTRLAVTKEGHGTLTLTGTSAHQVATAVKAGTLKLDGTFTASAVTVDPGATLTGSGALPAATVNGTLLLDASQAPLDFGGTLTLNNATLAVTGSTGDSVRVLATRAAMSGSFATITGVPVGYTLDTHHNGNAIALVRKATADYEIWAAGHALDPAGLGAPGSDPDGDGYANSVEFVLGMNPSTADAGHANLPRPGVVGADLVVTFTRIKAALGNGFESAAEWTADLEAGWNPVPVEQIQVTDHGTTETVSVTVPLNAASRGFVRVRVTGPLAIP